MAFPVSIDYAIICPVRDISDELKKELYDFVEELEKNGNAYFPVRDVYHSRPALAYFAAARMNELAKEIYLYWDENGSGSHLALGMLVGLNKSKPVYIINPDSIENTRDENLRALLKDLCIVKGEEEDLAGY